MDKETIETLMAATIGTKRIADACAKIAFNIMRLSEFVEDEKGTEIINELAEMNEEISSNNFVITAICKTIEDGKADVESVMKTMEKALKEVENTSDN